MIRVMVVDDSRFFKNRLTEIINSDVDMQVVATASNGQEALDLVAEVRPDVITMDIDMPVMDGITAVRKIMLQHPVPILMFSAQTHSGAESTLKALDAGALDFMTKRASDVANDYTTMAQEIILKIKHMAYQGQGRTRKPILPLDEPAVLKPQPIGTLKKTVDLIIIGTSTGGPVALQKIIQTLPENFPLPIVIVQHMPETFTATFAERLNSLCHVKVTEANHGMGIHPGEVLLAPGGKQLQFVRLEGKLKLKIYAGEQSMRYRPCIDVSFSSLAELNGAKTLGLILTGMGSDGREGARALKKLGAKIWVQDEASCVVFGMPSSVISAGLADEVIALEALGPRLVREFL